LSTPSQPKLKADPTTLETVKQEDHANDDDSEQELLENPRLEPIDVDNEEATPKRKVPARRLSKEEKEVALEFHKSHLLALLGHYLYLSDHVLSDATLQVGAPHLHSCWISVSDPLTRLKIGHDSVNDS